MYNEIEMHIKAEREMGITQKQIVVERRKRGKIEGICEAGGSQPQKKSNEVLKML